MKHMIFISAAVLLGACSTPRYRVQNVDSEIDRKGQVGDKEIGLNSDGEAILQENVDADDELRRQQWTNNVLTEKLETEHFELRRCRSDLSDPRLGGSGKLTEIPEIDNMQSIAGIKEEFGTNADGDLKVVRREYYIDRLKQERKIESKLRDQLKTVAKYHQDCKRTLGYARVKIGLPASRYSAKGYYNEDGSWVETRKAEMSLDDAFEIKAAESAQASGN